jgi:membrane-bound inhibitor of C-type lysozyme
MLRLPQPHRCLPQRRRGLPRARTGGGWLVLAAILIGMGMGASPGRSAATPQAEQAIRARYLCRGRFDAVELTALFFNSEPGEVILLVGEMATRLPRRLAASGSRYAAGGQEFWIKGETATWSPGPHPAARMACETRPDQSQR